LNYQRLDLGKFGSECQTALNPLFPELNLHLEALTRISSIYLNGFSKLAMVKHAR
jgi:hypothetical protein